MATINLGDAGLSPGNVIDPYLDQNFVSGNDVIVPAGTYKWNGGGFPGTPGRGTSISNASLVGDGDVFLQHSNGANVEWSWQIGSGDVTLRNITIRGVNGGNKTNYRFDCHNSSSTLHIDNFNLPDGASGGRGTGIFIGTNNSGTARISNCNINGMTDNGIRVCRGRAIIDGCHLINVDIDGIRAGGRTTIRNTVVEMNTNAVRTGRGIRVGGGCTSAGNVTIENCDFNYTASGAERVLVLLQGSGEVRNCRFRNNGSNPTIDLRTGGWSGSGNHHSGSQPIGDGSGWFSCVGSGCDPPRDAPNGDTGGGGEPSEDMSLFEVRAGDGVPNMSYSFTVNGDVQAGPNSELSGNDSIQQTGDGEFAVQGGTGNGFADDWFVKGTLRDWQTNKQPDEYTLMLEDQEISPGDFPIATDPSGTSPGRVSVSPVLLAGVAAVGLWAAQEEGNPVSDLVNRG